jgi:hypothetical protein
MGEFWVYVIVTLQIMKTEENPSKNYCSKKHLSPSLAFIWVGKRISR